MLAVGRLWRDRRGEAMKDRRGHQRHPGDRRTAAHGLAVGRQQRVCGEGDPGVRMPGLTPARAPSSV